MTINWFKNLGWIYIPTSVTGTVIIFLVVLLCVTVLVAVDQNSHSVSNTLYGIFPYFVSAFSVLFWIADSISKIE